MVKEFFLSFLITILLFCLSYSRNNIFSMQDFHNKSDDGLIPISANGFIYSEKARA